jgi:hypothetical protein
MKQLTLAVATILAATATAQDARPRVTVDVYPVETGIRINMNGREVQSPLAQPMMIDGHVMVPLRGIVEGMGASIEWHPDKRVLVRHEQRVVDLQIGRDFARVDGVLKPLSVEPKIVNGRTLVPVRLVAEGLGMHVMWDGDSRTVVITSRIDS